MTLSRESSVENVAQPIASSAAILFSTYNTIFRLFRDSGGSDYGYS